MISQRELERIKRQMLDLTYYSIETEILRELIETYEKVQGLEPTPPPPIIFPKRNSKSDD